MSLKARLRGLEAKVDWLERYGELRKVEQALKYRQSVKQVVDRLTANPQAAARLGVADMVGTRPGRGAASLADMIARRRAAVATSTGPPLEKPPEKPPEKPAAAPSPPPSPPKTETWTHDPPEHLQIEKVTWRRRGPEDDLDDDDDDEEYDALGGG